MDSPVGLHSYKPAHNQPPQIYRPIFLDYIIPASVMMESVPREFEKKFVRVERETLTHSNPIGDLVADNGGDNFIDVLIPGTDAQESVSLCNTLGELIDLIQTVGEEDKDQKDEMIRYLVEISKQMPIPNLDQFSVYLAKLEPPIYVLFPRENVANDVPTARVSSIARRRIPHTIEPAVNPALTEPGKRRHHCSVL